MDDISLPPSVPSLPSDVGSSCSASESQDSEAETLRLSDGEFNLPDSESDSDSRMGDELSLQDVDMMPSEPEEALGLPSLAGSLVPLPHQVSGLTAQHVAEYYSPPRVLPAARRLGLQGCLSLDLLTGWDLANREVQRAATQLLTTVTVAFLILCPPCTAFSPLQAMWNYTKMAPAKVQANMEAGMVHLRFAMDCALLQCRAGRVFVFEHPANATSWATAEVQRVLAMPGVAVVVFDQCMTGLASPLGTPIRKRTRLMTNSPGVVQAFLGRRCDRSHEHLPCWGFEHGIQLSTWCQAYPAPMVDLLASSALRCCFP